MPPTPTTSRHEPIAISVPEAARRLGIGRTLAYEQVATGRLPTIRIGRRLVVPVKSIENMIPKKCADDCACVCHAA